MAIKKFKISLIIIPALFIGMVIYGIYSRHQLNKHYAVTSGQIIEITRPGWKGSGDYSVIYNYKINNKEYNSNQDYNYCGQIGFEKVKSLIVGKKFPVVYQPNDPGNSIMMLTLKNSERFNVQLPDSVRTYDSLLMCK